MREQVRERKGRIRDGGRGKDENKGERRVNGGREQEDIYMYVHVREGELLYM